MVPEARGNSALVDAPVLRLCTAALADAAAGHGSGWVPKQLMLEVVYESNVKFCGSMNRSWAMRGAHFMVRPDLTVPVDSAGCFSPTRVFRAAGPRVDSLQLVGAGSAVHRRSSGVAGAG
jgi:hypothetical protein